MKAEIDAAIKAIVADIAERQEALKALRKLGGYDTAPMSQPIPPAPPARRRPNKKAAGKRGPYKKRGTAPPAAAPAAAPSPRAVLDGKADTVVGDIKRLLLDEAAPFTKEVLVENLVDDPDYRKLYEAEGGKRALENALYQWTVAGRLKKDGDNYTVTAAGREWFGK